MATYRLGFFSIGILALLLGVSVTGVARGQGGWPPLLGGQFRPLTTLRGEIVCVGCGLGEARRARPDAIHLYEMRYAGGRLVMNVEWISHQSRQYLDDVAGLTNTLRLRGPQTMIEELTDETARSKEVQVTGILRSTRTFDLLDVDVEAG